MTTEAQELKQALIKRPKQTIAVDEMLSTGSTLINLACTGRPFCGFAKGKYYFLVGDSASGKTWLSLSCMAEASVNPSFSDYVFYYDNVEDGALMDLEYYFGAEIVRRMRAPAKDEDKRPVFSDTVESFYYHLDDALRRAREKGKPFIYVLDSQDSLYSKTSDEKFTQQKQAFEDGKDAAGSYGDGKAKFHSENIRRVLRGLRDTGSILIIIGQTRDNLGMGFEKKTRSGGRALRFYATLELWSSIKEKLKKNVRGKPRTVGVLAEVKVKKNRINGRERTVSIPIYYNLGIDDVGSCVDYLVDEKQWEQRGGKIAASDLDFSGTREALIKHIEENDLEKDVRTLVGEVWQTIEDASNVKRKARY